jgi:hypothetical protein
VGRFEQRISDEQVQAARQQIAAGSSLRAAAAAIPCAASTLSVRIRKAEQAEAALVARAGIGVRRPARARAGAERGPAASGGEEAASVGPLAVLRGALQANRADGQPDWPTRVSAARALAALRPDELEPPAEPEPSPTIVYDLPPGATPILHRPQDDALASGGESAAQNLPDPGIYILEHGEQLIMLASHGDPGEAEAARIIVLFSRDDAAEVVRACGGDPAFLDRLPDSQPQTDSNQPAPAQR